MEFYRQYFIYIYIYYKTILIRERKRKRDDKKYNFVQEGKRSKLYTVYTLYLSIQQKVFTIYNMKNIYLCFPY